MSASKHHSHSINCPSVTYVKEVLGMTKCCPRRGCKGTMVDVVSRYANRGPIQYEKECSECGKIIKDPRYAKQREERWQNRQNKKPNSGGYRSSNNTTNKFVRK